MGRIRSLNPVWLAGLVFAIALISAVALSASGRASVHGAAMPAELTFKLMFSRWSPSAQLTKVSSGRIDIYIGGSLHSSTQVDADGLAAFNIPTSATTRWTMVIENFGHRHFRAEFSGGFLYLYNEDRSDRTANYYALSDGGYAMEYYQDYLYITNQGQPGGPILGQLNRTETTTATGIDAMPVGAQALTPTQTALIDTPGTAVDVMVVDNLLYVADDTGGLRIYDVSNPASPGTRGTLATIDSSISLVPLSSGEIVLGDKSKWREVDVSDPDNPTSNPGQDLNPTTKTLRARYLNNMAYAAESNQFTFYDDNASAGPPVFAGKVTSLGMAESLWVANNGSTILAYLADGVGGLRIYDVTTPAQPSMKGVVPVSAGGGTRDVAVSGGLAYIAEGLAGLRIVDVSTPESPVDRGQIATTDARSVWLEGSTVYVGDGTGGMRIIDVSNPAAPSLLASVISGDRCDQVVVKGNYAYMADGTAGVLIFDVTTTTADPIPEDDFGGGTDDPQQEVLPPAPVISTEFNTAITGAAQTGSSYSDNRVAGFGFDAGPGATGVSAFVGGMPGLMFQWVYAGTREPDIFWLPIGEEGVTPDGILWETLFGINSAGVPMLTLLRTFPPEFLLALAEGAHTMRYWLQDVEGNRSNVREEQVIIAPPE